MRRGAGSIVAWLRQRLRDLRYLFGDLIYAIGRALRSIGRLILPLVAFVAHLVSAAGRGIAAAWRGLSLVARRRLVAALVVAAAVFAFLELAVPALPCQFPAGDRCPPADNAAELIPADSLAYVHVNLDPETEQFEELKALAARVPLFAQQLATRALTLIPGPGGAARTTRAMSIRGSPAKGRSPSSATPPPPRSRSFSSRSAIPRGRARTRNRSPRARPPRRITAASRFAPMSATSRLRRSRTSSSSGRLTACGRSSTPRRTRRGPRPSLRTSSPRACARSFQSTASSRRGYPATV